MKVRVADYIVNRLNEAGINTVFLLNGGGMMHLVDAVARNDKMKVVCNHHEQASAMAADGFSRFSGEIAACFATSGPGGTNVITGLVGAWQDSSKVLFVTGQSKSTQTIANSNIDGLRQFGTFEVDIVPIAKSVTKYAYMLIDPQSVRFHLEKALHLIASGRPGPVLLDIPLDIQGALVDPSQLHGFIAPVEELLTPVTDLQRLSSMVVESKRPVWLVGNGVRISGAVSEFRKLAENLKIPIVTTQLGKDIINYKHPLFVGHSGPKGDRAGNFAIQTADLIISVGCSLHGQTTGWENQLFAPEAIKVQVDIDQSLLEREDVGVELKIKLPVERFIDLFAGVVNTHVCEDWLSRCLDWKNRYAVYREPHLSSAGSINVYHFIDYLSEILANDVCITSDAGSAFYIVGQGLLIKEGQRFISSGSLGAMGFALPAACGVAFADPNNMSVCITGDGSLMTNLHELATASHYNLNIKIFIINNNGYLSMKNTQKAFFGGGAVASDESSGVFIPSIKAIADTFRIRHVLCGQNEDMSSLIPGVLAEKGPVICELTCQQDQVIMPSVGSKRLDDGRMVSAPLHDMSPNLSDVTLEKEMHFDIDVR